MINHLLTFIILSILKKLKCLKCLIMTVSGFHGLVAMGMVSWKPKWSTVAALKKKPWHYCWWKISQGQPHRNPINNGINHQPQLVNPGFLNHQQYQLKSWVAVLLSVPKSAWQGPLKDLLPVIFQLEPRMATTQHRRIPTWFIWPRSLMRWVF